MTDPVSTLSGKLLNHTCLCKACGSAPEYFDSATILGKYKIDYLRCGNCGLIRTENPYWLEESYSDAIASADIGLVGRNILQARQTRTILSIFFGTGRTFVDYGGGYGLFVRLMRDHGFDFFRYDKYCPNLFAKGFDVTVGERQRRFDLLTAFEVFEHLTDPAAELDQMLSLAPNILFSTCLVQKENPRRPADWWYYVLSSGQHVTLYTMESLGSLARDKNRFFYSAGDVHLFTERPIADWKFLLLAKRGIGRIAGGLLPKKKSLLGSDFYRLTGQTIG